MPTRGKDAVFAEEMQQLVSHSVQQLLVPMRKEIIDGQKAESAKIVREVNDLGTTVSDLKATVSDLSSTFETRITAIESDLAEAKKSCASNLDTMLKEMCEVEEKRSNILIFGLPEPMGAGRNSPRDQDISEVDKILEKIVGRKVAFNVKFRIGAKAEDKTRPIVVKLRDNHEKEEILAGSSALKTHEEWKDVYIKQDLTKSQRALGKKHEEELKKEAERRNTLLKNGEDWTWGIRGRGFLRHLIKLRNTV